MTIKQPLPRSTPEAEGISSADILKFVQAVETVPHPHSFMLLRHGKVVAEGWWKPYRPEVHHLLFSLTKSFTSTAVGLAEAEGKLALSERLVDIFPDDLPAKVSENLKAMTIYNLLTMNTGHAQDATNRTLRGFKGQPNPARNFLSIPVKHQPGTFFVYNSAASHLLSMIVQMRTGQTLQDYLKPRLFDPLGIQVESWEKYVDGVNFGGWGLSLKTEDIAKFGQLYLQKGAWQGQQLVPADWVARATSKQVDNSHNQPIDWKQGYGFQFWRCRNNLYRGDGAFGQYCIVMPDQEAVLAYTSGVADMQAVLNQVMEVLLPAFRAQPLVADPGQQAALLEKLSGLQIPPVQGKASPRQAMALNGKRITFSKNRQALRWLSFDFAQEEWNLEFKDRWGTHQVRGGYGQWLELESNPEKIAASGGWTAPDTFEAWLARYDTPFILQERMQVTGDQAACVMKQNVGFAPPDETPAIGKIA